jgi:hypothetical protein
MHDAAAKLIRTRLLGESLRECGVLVLIFAPLDTLLEVKGTVDWRALCWLGVCISWQNIALVFFAVVGIFLLYYGIEIEGEAELALQELEKGDLDDILDGSV